MTATEVPGHRLNLWQRVNRGETSFDFAGLWKRWVALSSLIILIGIGSLLFRGLNFSIDFRGGTVWEVPSTASVAHVRNVVGNVSSGLRQATIQILTSRQTGKTTVEVQATTKETSNPAQVNQVTAALAKMGGVSTNQVTINSVGPSWGHDITVKAIRALIVFFVVIAVFVWFWFEPKMALAALIAVFHDVILTVGIYSLSGFQVSPDTVIAFLTILGYSLYDTIVVFDKVAENTKSFGSSGRLTYTELVDLSMNQVLARSLNTTLVAIMPILSILVIGAWILGATALNDFGLALFIGLATGAYSSIFIASPLLGVFKERETYWVGVRQRLGNRPAGFRFSPAAFAAGGLAALGSQSPGRSSRKPASARRSSTGPGRATRPGARRDGGQVQPEAALPPMAEVGLLPGDEVIWDEDVAPTPDGDAGPGGPDDSGGGAEPEGDVATAGAPMPGTARSAGPANRPTSGSPAARSASRPPPRPRKKGRRR